MYTILPAARKFETQKRTYSTTEPIQLTKGCDKLDVSLSIATRDPFIDIVGDLHEEEFSACGPAVTIENVVKHLIEHSELVPSQLIAAIGNLMTVVAANEVSVRTRAELEKLFLSEPQKYLFLHTFRIITFLLACLSNGSRLFADSVERPNIVVFLSDDMGWDQPGFQGGEKVATPNLDRIAREGVQLTQFYVQSVCSPTRAALMTGRYPFRNGMEERSHGIDIGGMLPDERTLPQSLQSAGYSTAIFGKWHLGAWYKHHLPLQRGFEHQFGFYGALIDSFSHRREQTFDWHRNEELLDQPGYSTFLIADEFFDVLVKRERAKPFFYYVAFNAVHGPHGAPPEYVDKHRGDLQLAMLECMDVAIGRMFTKLESEGILDETLIVYFNDNGGPKRVATNGPYRGFKGETYEGGVRVPCAMRWPRHLMANSKCDEMLHVVDLYPTFVKLAHGSLQQPLPLDGRDAWPSIAHGQPSPHLEIVLSVPGLESSETGPPSIRVGDYKLVGDELYNIKLDAYEKNDIAIHNSDRVQSMKDRLASLAAERRPPEAHGRPSDVGSLVLGQLESQAPIPVWLQKQNEKLAQDPQPTKRDRKQSKGKTVPLSK